MNRSFGLMLMGLCWVAGMVLAEEPAATNMNITLPEAAPIVEEKPAVPAPAATTNAPAPAQPEPAPAVPAVEPVVATPEQVPDLEEGNKAWDPKGPWKVGARWVQFKLDETHRGGKVNGDYVGTYMGSISYLDEEQVEMPRCFVQYRIKQSPVWIGLTYDHVRAVTLEADKNPDHGDGTVDIAGFEPYVQAAWENKTLLTPYIQLGYVFYSADFEENEWGDGGNRYVKLNNPNGVEIAGGLDIRLYRNLQLDLFVRQMTVDDVKGSWYSGGSEGGDVIFPLSNTAYGIGLLGQF
jgi:hypothetical protein